MKGSADNYGILRFQTRVKTKTFTFEEKKQAELLALTYTLYCIIVARKVAIRGQ